MAPRRRAEGILKKRRDFQAHLVAYVVIDLVGWGIGLVLNAWDVYFRRPITEADVRREIGRMADGS